MSNGECRITVDTTRAVAALNEARETLAALSERRVRYPRPLLNDDSWAEPRVDRDGDLWVYDWDTDWWECEAKSEMASRDALESA